MTSTPDSHQPDTSDVSRLQSPRDLTGHPKAFRYFFWGEFSERASYYGMRAILPLYLTTVLKFDDATAAPIFFWFKMACYFLPLVGGYLADRFLGKYWTIVGFSIPYVLGHFVLGIESQVALVIALTLLAGGSGVIKPNISTLMGLTYDQQRPGQEQLRSSAFLWYYFAINVGALISTLALPYLRDHYGYAVAFQFPAWLMIAALAVFASGKRYYAKEPTDSQKLTAEERRIRWKLLQKLSGVFSLIVFYWVAYEHNDSLWVYFIRDHVQLSFGASLSNSLWKIAPDQLQSINPFCVIIFAPLFSWLFGVIDPAARRFSPANKMLAGFLLQVVASGIMATAGFLVQSSGEKVSLAWPASAYFCLTLGEILVIGTGLELFYAAAPQNMKSFVTGCFLVTSAIANFINTQLAGYYNIVVPPGEFFGISAGIVLIAAVGFYYLTRSMVFHHEEETVQLN